MKIGIVGFSAPHFDQKNAKILLEKKLRALTSELDSSSVQIVSGYTNSGVPKLAYELADYMKLKTVGFSAKQALTVSTGVYPVDKEIIFGKNFGDESEAFINYIDILIRIGGGKQSRHEVALFKEKNLENNLSSILFEVEVEWYGK